MGCNPGGDRDGGTVAPPDVVGLQEAARMLDVDPQRVREFEMRRAAGRRPEFPEPTRLACGPVWWRSEIEAFDRRRPRVPGPRGGVRAGRLIDLSEKDIRRHLGPDSPLTDRERRVVARRFGLDGSPAGTLEEVAAGLGVSPATVKLDQRRALEKIGAGVGGRAGTGETGGEGP